MSLSKLLAALIMSSLPRSTEDWKPGDLAICINGVWPVANDANPKEGDLVRVRHVCMAGLFLHFEGKPDDRHWMAVHFRKAERDTAPADDEAWIGDLQRFRRKLDA